MNKILKCAAFSSLLPLFSCASVTGGSKQKVTIDSEPRGARVLIDGVDHGKTPLAVDLSRRTSHLVEISMTGYNHYEVTVEPTMNNAVYGNLIVGGPVGMLFDEANGATNSLQPSEIRAALDRR